MLKDKLQKRKLFMKAEIAMFRGNQIVEETTLLEEIQKNNSKKQKKQKKLEKIDSQAWNDDRVVYMDRKIYISGEILRTNPIEKLQSSKHRISRITKDAQFDQEKLLMIRNMKQYQEIHPRMLEILTEQSLAHKDRKTSLIGNISRTIVRNQC